MVATEPGGPKTSKTTCFGLNGTTSFALPLGVDVTSCEAKMPLRRYTVNPATATTAAATSSIQRRLSPLLIENRGIGDPFDKRRRPDGRGVFDGRPYIN